MFTLDIATLTGTMHGMDIIDDLARQVRQEYDSANTRRRSNYAYAKTVGFTAKEARYLCKRSRVYIDELAGARKET